MRDPLARVWTCALAFAGGAALGRFPGAFAVCGLGIALALARRHRVLALVGLGLIGLSAGSLDAAWHSTVGDPLDVLAAGSPRCSLSGRVQEEVPPWGWLVRISVADCGDSRVTGGVVVIGRLDAPAGSQIEASGWLLQIRDGSFNQGERRAGASADFHPQSITVGSITSPAFALAAAIRGSLSRAVESIDPRQAALLKGVSIGDTSDFDPETLEDFRRSGLSHLLAVSGENLAMLMGAVAFLASRLPRRSSILVMAAAAAMFLLVVGPQPSVLRASVMAGIALAAMAIGRSADPLVALGVAVVVVIALKPGLVFAPGLQLSAAATCGIVVWARRISLRLGALPTPIALGLAATISAQIAVAPLLVAIFGQISATGVIANLLALPAVPPATVFGLAAGALGTISVPAATALVAVARPFLAWILWIAAMFGRPSWAAIATPSWMAWPLGFVVAAWLACGFRNREPLALSLPSCSPGPSKTRTAPR